MDLLVRLLGSATIPNVVTVQLNALRDVPESVRQPVRRTARNVLLGSTVVLTAH